MARLIAVCLMLLALGIPEGARGAAVFGADLTQSVSASGPCGSAGQACSLFSDTTSAGTLETGSPTTGALVSVRLRHYNTLALQVALRVFRNTGTPGEFLSVGPEIPVIVPQDTVPGGEVTEYPMHHSIAAGDRIGLGYLKPSYVFQFAINGGPQVCLFHSGAHPVDTVASYDTPGCQAEVLISGTVEPDADGDGYGDETQDSCPSSAATQGDCPTAPQAGDSRPPSAKLGGRRTQDAVAKRRVTVFATPDEAAQLKASGTITTAGAARVLKLKSAKTSVPAGTRARLDLKLSRKVVRRVRRALRRGAKVRARITVVARDGAGNTSSSKRTVRIKRKR